MLLENEILTLINEDKQSTLKRNAEEGHNYYDGQHDILKYRLFYYNADGQLVEDTTRSNIKICHQFFTELVDQCVQYLLSGKDPLVASKIPELQAFLDEYFDEDFISELSDTLTDCCSGGFGYMYAYKSIKERTAFAFADAMGVVEVRAKDTDTNTDNVIYWYIDRIAKTNKKIRRIQVWDDQQTTYYVSDEEGKLELDADEPINPRPHILYTKEGDDAVYYDGFGFIPFFRVDSNRKKTSHLKPVKEIIDDYDLMACGLSNNLVDFDTPVHIVKGFQGDNLDELQTNLKTKKIVGVEPDGGIEVKTVDVPYEARIAKLELDDKNIYRFGMGFNSSQLGDGNITNVVIKSRYTLLDLKCNKLAKRVKAFLKKLVKVVIDEINAENDTDYKVSDVYINISPEVITNAADNANIEKTKAETKQIEINTLLNIAMKLDDETLMSAICDILELDYEEIKDRLPSEPQTDLNAASEALANVQITEGGGADE